jgi:aspartyl-tRNA synthetase
MHPYRTHNCAQLRAADVGSTVRLSGWIHRKRDHGGVLFIDLRDHYGLTQIVGVAGSEALKLLDSLRLESVVTVTGDVVARGPEVVNPRLATGEIEVVAREVTVQSAAAELPLPVATEAEYPEEIRLRYRYLDLRREQVHANIMLRAAVIASIRKRMIEQGFTEFQTPILTASSPEGARDYLVPSRVHPGKFYALPQAPQMFKQLIMVAGFDRYFQIAPCFRDEDARADRSPGRVLPARLRNELRHPGRRLWRHRAGASRPFRGVRQRQGGDSGRQLPAHSLQGSDAEIRQRQAGPQEPDSHFRRRRPFPWLGLRPVRQPR